MDLTATQNWLRQVLASYAQQDRVSRDVEATLRNFPTLAPKMDRYTTDDGHTQIMLCLHGTVPISFRSSTYHIPVAIWFPVNYPLSPPISFVTPTSQMLVRPSKFVDVSGKIYHPYLAYWDTRNEKKSTTTELVAIMQQIFSIEPPVYQKPDTSLQPQNPSSSPSTTQHRVLNPINSPVTSAVSSGTSSPTLQSTSILGNPVLNQANGFRAYTRSPIPAEASQSEPLPPALPTKPEKVISLRNAVNEKLASRLQHFNKQMAGEMDALLMANKGLNQGTEIIANERKRLEEIEDQLRTNIAILSEKNKELTDQLEQIHNEPDVDVDTLICGISDDDSQLFELVADENAIEDVIYYLGKALNSERIDLGTYMKHVRTIAREQFMRRALIKKIRDTKISSRHL
ncbi:UEV-domain-containing protein [Basidiobolus meristosporus CBS 931.73]|uniref:UEV-domain-containing protein n=1 Tax=Basidiobolus meristosporus CBS 931.73 TaxID=1314790 RepID=A0A1Y1YD06_9FUNG|nr:UEV-domain-containing protein [Basidiobolus meristosporus CBS 931.73]|eukprot:ORX95813.1 UEV-domain-containing protein [Basidiobolus meristosporus CBS 931.73]